MASTFVKMRKISNVAANISYLQNRDKHPDICHVYSTCSNELWQEYAKVNQEAFRASNQSGKCVEAHEFILVFPNEFYRLSNKTKEQLHKDIIDTLQKKYGVEIFSALHGSDSDSKNMHIHGMYMERKLEQEQDKIAKRNMYFDPEGRQVRAKKDAIDSEGNLLPGFRMVPKGECYGKKSWTAKDKKLRGNAFTHQMKIWWTNVLNNQKQFDWAKDMETREVYDHNTSPYLPLQDTHKPLQYSNEEKQEEADEKYQEYVKNINESNQLRRQYNQKVREALEAGSDKKELVEQRKKLSADIRQALEGSQKGKINEILLKGINILEKIIESLRGLKTSLTDKIKNADNRKYPEINKITKNKSKGKNNIKRGRPII